MKNALRTSMIGAIGIFIGFWLGIMAIVAATPVEAARENDVWVVRFGSYIESVWSEGRDVLINGTNKYLNFGSISGSTGYGFRDNAGTIEYKNDGGSWTGVGTGGGGGGLAAADIDTEAELEALVTDVTDFFTNNDGALDDDDLSDNTTTDLAEGTNLYFTNARAITALTSQNISIFTNDSGYITDGNTGWDNSYGFITSADDTVSGTELDGVFSTTGLLLRSGAGTYSTITNNSSNWNTAFGWGDHAGAGYLTGNQTITLSGDVSGSGSTAITTVVADDSHAHTGATISGIDISDDTNLAAGRSLTLTGDSVAADEELYTDTKCIWFEAPTADDDFKSIFKNHSNGDYTITKIWAESDQTVAFDLQIDDGTPADVNGTDITPAAGEAEDTTLSGDTTLGAGEELDLVITSVTGDPTWFTTCWTFTKND